MSEQKGAVFTKALKKHTVRAKEKLLESLGKADRTTDEIFEDQLNNFSKQQRESERLQRDLKNYVTCAKAFSQASKQLQEAIRDIYEPFWPNSEHVRAMTQSIEILSDEYCTKLNDQALTPLNSYCSQFPELRNKISKRGRKLVDYDSARHNFEDLQTKRKDDGKLLKAQEQLDEAKKWYEDINTELLAELPSLFDERIVFLASHLQTIFNVEEVFHSETHKLNADLGKHMDRLGYEAAQLREANGLDFAERKSSSHDSTEGRYTKKRGSQASANNTPEKSGGAVNTNGEPTPATPVARLSVDNTPVPTTPNTDAVLTTPASSYRTPDAAVGEAGGTNKPDYDSAKAGSSPRSSLSAGDSNTKPSASPSLYPKVPVESQNGKESPNPFEEDDEENLAKFVASLANVESVAQAPIKTAEPPPTASLDSDGSNGVPAVPPASSEPSAQQQVLYHVRATHPYVRVDEDELSFEAGEVIKVIPYEDPEDQDEGWLLGIAESTGKRGMFPANFTKREL